MENLMFENMSRMEICRRMSAHCQRSADETPAGDERETMQRASDKFKDEADQLAFDGLLAALIWPDRPRRA
jgi:hypothetical protein